MRLVFGAAAALSVALTLNLTAATLNLGDSAPELKVSKWVKGTPVEKLESGKVYVVEYWATWCGPCRATIPHLSELARKFEGKATFIGMDVWERGDAATVEKNVRKFVEDMGDKMSYNVAMDTADTYMADHWMKAAGQNGIPAAFIVDKAGKIAWIGHPMGGLDTALDQVVEGTYDIGKAKKKQAARQEVEKFKQAVAQGGDLEELRKQGKAIEALDKELGGIEPSGAFDTEKTIQAVKFNSAMMAYQKEALQGSDADQLAKLEAAARAVAPEKFDFDQYKAALARSKSLQGVQAAFNQYMQVVTANGDQGKAAELAKKLGEMEIKDPTALNQIAWILLTNEQIKHRDLALAIKFAKAAVDASGGKDAAILDTYARAMADSGKLAEAIDWQKKAVAACPDNGQKPELEATLKAYQAKAEKAK